MVGCPSVRPSVPSIGWFAAERPAYAAYQLSVCCWRPRSAANAGSVMSKAGFKGGGGWAMAWRLMIDVYETTT